VTVTGARNPAGDRLRFVSNWSWDPTRVAAPAALRDLLSGETIPRHGPIALGAWDVRVLVEAPPDTAPAERRVGAEPS
jgi:beta-galactosidase